MACAEDWKKYSGKQDFWLQPLLDIHLGSVLLQESQPDDRGDRDSVYALSAIAFFILIIAWVNYLNLATAKSFERANEVGVRKVMGAQKPRQIREHRPQQTHGFSRLNTQDSLLLIGNYFLFLRANVLNVQFHFISCL